MAAQKVISTTLDRMEFGEETTKEKEGKYRKYPLPEGITRKMLLKDITTLAFPSMIELFLTQLTSMADEIMVGHLPGEVGVRALSAVGLCTLPKMMLMTCMLALNTGTTAIVARFRGMERQDKANVTFKQSLLLNFVLGIFFMICGTVFAYPIIKFIAGDNIAEETIQYAVSYFKIQMYGMPILIMTNTMTATLRAIGDSKMPLFYNTLANVVNLFFNYCLIYGHFGMPRMEVAGASLATVIGQCTAFAVAFSLMLSKKRYVYLDFKEKFVYDSVIMENVVKIGLPSMAEQLIMRLGIMLYTKILTNLGDTAYATHHIAMNIQSLSFMTGQAFATAATTLMGQSLGRKRLDMADNYLRCTRTVSFFVSMCIATFLATCGKWIVALYNSDPTIIEMGGKVLFTVAFMQPFQSSQFCTAGGLRGAGDTRFPAIAVLVTVVGVRVGLAQLLVNMLDLGLMGAWYALIGDQLARTALMLLRYRTGKWRFIKLKQSKIA